jgi:hypothetical protein
VKYTWTGNAGDPLLRQYARGDSGGATWTYGSAATVASNVQEFSLVYDKRTVAQPVTNGTSAEQLLASSELSLLNTTNSVTSSNWFGQTFKPTLPGNAVSWAVTRVKVQAKYNSTTDGVISVQLRPVSGGLPTASILAQATLAESTLTSAYAWQQISYANATGFPPSASLALVLAYTSGTAVAADIQGATVTTALTNSNMVSSTNGGSSWSASALGDLNFDIYGTVTTPNAVTYLYYLTDVRAAIRCGSDSNSRQATSVRLISEPQVTGP